MESTRHFSLFHTRETFLKHFLFVSLLVIAFYVILDIYNEIYVGALTDFICGIALGISLFSLLKSGMKEWHIHLTLFGGIMIFAPLLVLDSFGDTGLFWLPTMPVLTFMLGGTGTGLLWGLVYFACLALSMVLAATGVISLQYSWDHALFMLLVTTFMGIVTYIFVRYLEKAEATLLQQQKQLTKALQQAKAGSQAKSQFLSTVSHELRTPLHGIIGLQELLSESSEKWSDEEKENLQLSLQSSYSLKNLLNDVLDLSKIESAKQLLEMTEFDTMELLKSALIPFVFQAKSKNVDLLLTLNGVPKEIKSDVSRLRQILLNLLGNAVKFTVQGHVHLIVEKSDNDGELLFTIEDTGVGIPEDEITFIFDSFYQCSNRDVSVDGTGLGTTIVKQSVEALGGNLTVQSSLGEGTRFNFSLPCQVMNDEVYHLELRTDEILDLDHVTNETSDQSIKTLRMLLVEDDEISRKLAEKAMKRSGLNIVSAVSGEHALQILGKSKFDILLTDLRMPGIDGIDLTRKVRESEKECSDHLPIIGLSAHALSSVVDEAKAAGMDDFILKPATPAKILESVGKLIGVKNDAQGSLRELT